ncbi:MAG TPA: hypothetical protein GXX17_06615 [Clostridiales bacterium]|nr:hypothetical protein [Clostridiales bacterium]
MDNTKYYTGSLAYDFDLFLPREKKKNQDSAKIVRMPKANSRTRTLAVPVAQKVGSVLTVAFILAMVFMQLYLRVQINEINDQIHKKKAAVEELISEETRLQMELERKISYKNLEEAAEALGMRKKERSQVTYIRVNNANVAECRDGKVIYDSDKME